MADLIQSIRGMDDFLPERTQQWQLAEKAIQQAFAAYDYAEIRFPILEKTALFKRSIGEATDVVEKEMYTFDDRNGDSLSLRPEGTASCMRAVLQHGLQRQPGQRLWYYGPMFRHERPQKGRYRQFHQFGAELLGVETPESEVEIIALCASIFKRLGLANTVRLQLNTLGTLAERQAYRAELMAYWEQHADQLDPEAQARLHKNPLRLLDSKKPEMQPLIAAAPQLMDHLSTETRAHFERVCTLLDGLGIAYDIVPTLVRGLDYYCHTVFEWVTDALGAQGTVCAGGRYDGLATQLGSKQTVPSIGMALGMERLMLLLQQAEAAAPSVRPHAYLVLAAEAQLTGMQLAEQWRQRYPTLLLSVNMQGGSFKAQFKRADRSGAALAIVLGEDELAAQQVLVKSLRDDSIAQQQMPWDACERFLEEYLCQHI